MRPQTFMITMLTLVLGGSSAAGLRQYIRQGTPKPDTVTVVVAAMDIASNSTVSADVLKTQEYPKDLIPTGAILKIDDAIERSAYTSFVKDEPILDSKLSPRGEHGLAPKIPKGMRAFTINTPNVASGVAGFILPGNKVDVLLTVSTTGNGSEDITGGGSTTTLLQNVEVMAVDQRIEAPAENKVDTKELRSVTLLVTPDQAARLDLGQNKGTLHLSLRSPEDDLNANVRPATVNDIQFRQEAPVRPWDERAKDLFKAVGAAVAQSRPVAMKTPVVKTPQKKMIRTIKGSHEGMVIITPAGVTANDGS